MGITPLAPPTRRDRWGRYQVLNPITGKVEGLTRATTISGSLDDKTNLIAWKARTVIIGLATRPDLVALAGVTDATDKRTLDDIAERASDAGGATLRRDLGTAVHGFFAARLDDPEAVVPAPYDADVAAILKAIDDHGFEVVAGMVERMVVHWRHKIAGTFDLILRDKYTGTLHIADLKTGSSLLGALGFATQLSIYAQADCLYSQGAAADGSQDITEPMPEVSKSLGFILHCQPGTAVCEIHALDLTVGAAALELAMQVREARKCKPLSAHPLTLTVEEAIAKVIDTFPGAELVTHVNDNWRQWMTGRIQAIKDAGGIEQLAMLWPTDCPPIPTGEPITIDQGIEIATAASSVEKLFEIAFPEPLVTPTAVQSAVQPAAAPTRRPRPDEGGKVEEEAIAELNGRAKQLPVEAIAWVANIIEGARAANYPIRLSGPGSRRTERRLIVCSAVIDLAAFEDEPLARALVAIAIGEEIQPGHDLAAAIGSLSIDEATRLQRLADAVANTSLTPIWGDDGVAISGDIEAALAA